MKFVLSTMALILLSGCSAEAEKQPLSIPDMSNQSEQVKTLVTENWDALLVQCPGLTKYQDDLRFSKITTYLESYMGDEARVDVEYVVNDDNIKIPASYKAWGHHCFFSLYTHDQRLAVPKRACASVCLDKNMFAPENDHLMKPEGFSANLAN